MKTYTIFAIAASVLLATGLHAETGKLAFVIGKVEVGKSDKTWHKAQLGETVNQGDFIRTGKDGTVVVHLKSGATLKLKPNSHIALSEIGDATTIDVNAGSLFSKIDKRKAGQTYRIRAQTLVAAVRGTEFFFAYGRKTKSKSDMWLCVNEGSVHVTDSSSSSAVDVNKGEGIIVPVGKSIPKPKAYSWTKNLNWNMEPAQGSVIDKTNLRSAYNDLLKNNYD
ncbi:MAG: hypothetical protein LDLANPLL_01901 [Turneriella sp.]|nr:hypothetical protein [Turneriella sp.]